ncbi:hypothetical protein Mal15_37320 [Stieleria maiorica]|uniref:Uncharacterized protein n=1 Tax=Stieleria maiorica TaxID=2795974 RepID=A0A5B9MHZ6_9BACT|nr:hypothetical protein Mal15_37320 [Stieleria maiorica]
MCWCKQLSEILADDSDAFPGIAEFRGLLEDASWLANWKREHATIEICRSSIPDLLNELLQVSETDLATERPSVCEEIVHTLGSDSDG